MDAALAGRAAALAARLADLTGGTTRIEDSHEGALVLCVLDPLMSQDTWPDIQAALDDADAVGWSVRGRGPGPQLRLLRAELRPADPGTA